MADTNGRHDGPPEPRDDECWPDVVVALLGDLELAWQTVPHGLDVAGFGLGGERASPMLDLGIPADRLTQIVRRLAMADRELAAAGRRKQVRARSHGICRFGSIAAHSATEAILDLAADLLQRYFPVPAAEMSAQLEPATAWRAELNVTRGDWQELRLRAHDELGIVHEDRPFLLARGAGATVEPASSAERPRKRDPLALWIDAKTVDREDWWSWKDAAGEAKRRKIRGCSADRIRKGVRRGTICITGLVRRGSRPSGVMREAWHRYLEELQERAARRAPESPRRIGSDGTQRIR